MTQEPRQSEDPMTPTHSSLPDAAQALAVPLLPSLVPSPQMHMFSGAQAITMSPTESRTRHFQSNPSTHYQHEQSLVSLSEKKVLKHT